MTSSGRALNRAARLLPGAAAGTAPGLLIAAIPVIGPPEHLSGSFRTGLLVLLAVAASVAPLAALGRARLVAPLAAAATAAAALAVLAQPSPGRLAGFALAAGLLVASTASRGTPGYPAAAAAGTICAAALATASWRAAFGLAAGLAALAVVALLLTRLSGGLPTAAEARRRILGTGSVRRLLTLSAVLGVLTVPAGAQTMLLLAARGWSPSAQALGLSGLTAAAVAGAGVAARLARRRPQPARDLRAATATLAVAGVLVAVAAGLPTVLALPALAGSAAAVGATAAVAAAVGAAALPADHRGSAAALGALWFWAYGTLGGLVLATTIRHRFGDAVALAVLATPVLIGLRMLHRAQATADEDVLRVEIDTIAAAMPSDPSRLLECRGIDFSYGAVQVLFDVGFAVADGEMVALLGTNGAGKSTLLRVVSGLGIPSAGTVRFLGEDVTFVDPERRLRRGIAQIPGGKAVFGPMTVVENLRAYGFTHGRNRLAVERGIEESFEAFPRLLERRNQNAGTLSGGEQQMLALAKAFMLRPRLLLIDELSLGLAPKVVAELLEMVRRINAAGTAVVLVEQSVNVALSLVHRAYFMEKGAVQFEGPAGDLLERPDLLRSVFLEGAARGLAR